jgi:hypothetical protein
MMLKFKVFLLALSAGAVALSTGTCLARFVGDAMADQLWLGAIN